MFLAQKHAQSNPCKFRKVAKKLEEEKQILTLPYTICYL